MRLTLRKASLLAASIAAVVMVATAQEKPVKKAPIKESSPASGKAMFKQYCAVCHGVDARGDGPAAASLKIPPADLTTLAKRNDGKFPEEHVASVLRFGVKAPAHGSSDMPIWGRAFQSLNGGDPAIVTMRINNLSSYIKSLQVK
jgi:mono/diheme cytochrome c family protein